MADDRQRRTEPNDQNAVFDFLGDAATHHGAPVRRFDTHSSAVFLAGDRALKVKRAVRFPFLDYSTLDKRKAACSAELEVNRRFAPALYRRIVPITRQPDGRLALDGDGEPVEWAVEMTRFDENQTLDHLVEREPPSRELLERLAAIVVAMHEKSDRANAAAWLTAIESYIGQNTAEFRSHPDFFPTHLVDDLEQRSRAALGRLMPLLVERGQKGLIRRGHGDLHLGNIAMIEGEPVAFDAIEFDPVVASGDVLYDLAFLLMDLVERDLVEAANVVLNGYFLAARRADDCDGLAALPLFMSLRASIRAKVTASRLNQSPSKRDEVIRLAKRYFMLALDLLKPAKPVLTCSGGLSGTGKSVLARSLAPLLPPLPGALVLRSDVERKALFGIPETDRLPPEAYRSEVSERLYALLNDRAGRILRAGYSVVVDAVFARETERRAVEDVAREYQADFRGLFLTADLATRLARIGGRGPDASDANSAVALQQEGFDLGSLTWQEIDASGTPNDTLVRALTAFGKLLPARP